MIRRDEAKSAADELLAAAILGDGWPEALQRLADAAEAGGATLMRLRSGRPLARFSSTGWVEADSAMLAGQAPRSPRLFYPDHVFGSGFLGDTDIWAEQDLLHDPYFQEFLRPRGVFYHAKARLFAEADERISISLKRFAKFGPYEPAAIAGLDKLLPELRMAVRIARRVLDAEASAMARLLHQRGDPVFELDSRGRVLRAHGDDGEHLGIVVRDRRIMAFDRLAQVGLERAVAGAVGPLHEPAMRIVTNERGERRFLNLVPITGQARDVFPSTAAVLVVIEPGRQKGGAAPALTTQAFGLTVREAQIAALLAEGSNLGAIAECLHLGLGTVRNHLKRIFDKTDTRRQGELVALLRSLQL